MAGNFVDGAQYAGFTLGSRLKKHCYQSFKVLLQLPFRCQLEHWQIEGKGPVGICRGVMQMSQRRWGSVLA